MSETFDRHYDPDSFCFSTKFNSGLIRIIGLNSALTLANSKGKGKISEEAFSFLKKEWSDLPSNNEIRIAVFHHNVLPPFSTNTLEERDSLLNSGEMIDVLADLGCDLLLSGHCHDSYLYNFNYNVLGHHGFKKSKNLSYISTGTSGGYSSTGDRARSFNLIEILPSVDKNVKNLILTPFVFDSRNGEWLKQSSINSKIN